MNRQAEPSTYVAFEMHGGDSRAKKNRFGFYVVALSVCLSIWTKLHWGPQTVDDAYITFRYAANLLAGHGFVYNSGERVLGTTSPLYTLLIWGAAAVSGERNLPFLAFAINVAFDALSPLLLAALALELGANRLTAALVALAYALSASFVYFGCGGMETVLFVFWLLVSFNAYLRGWSFLAFASAGLAAVTRPEGLVLLAVLGTLDTVLERRVRRAIVAGILPLTAWMAFAWWYFGNPIPHSVLAKTSPIYDPRPPFAIFLALGWHLVRVTASTVLPIALAGSFEPALRVVVLLVATLIVLRSASSARAWAIPSFIVLFWAGYGLANRSIAEWYPVPLEPLYLVVLLVALAVVSEALAARTSLGTSAPTVVFLLMAALVVPARLREFAVGTSPFSARRWIVPEGFWRLEEREGVYREAAAMLAPVVTPKTVVALPEIGAFGYFSRARVLDTAGLVSPIALRYYPLSPALKATNNAVPPDLVHDLAPDYVASLEIFVRASLLRDPRFLERYELAFRLPTACFGSRGFLVFRRKDLQR